MRNEPCDVITLTHYCDGDQRAKDNFGRGPSTQNYTNKMAERRLWGSYHVELRDGRVVTVTR